eukprot:scaffold71528_cov14-Tisochrysis_lutea.AAC.1
MSTCSPSLPHEAGFAGSSRTGWQPQGLLLGLFWAARQIKAAAGFFGPCLVGREVVKQQHPSVLSFSCPCAGNKCGNWLFQVLEQQRPWPSPVHAQGPNEVNGSS